MYLNWKSTINDEEYENKKVNFKTYERISMINLLIDIVPHFNYLGIIMDKHLSSKSMQRWSLGNFQKLMVF